MREIEQKAGSRQAQKDKIRKRYQRAEAANVTVIPAKPQKQPFDQEQHCRVGVYGRKMGAWIRYQRKSYRGRPGRKQTLTKDKIERLNAIGMRW